MRHFISLVISSLITLFVISIYKPAFADEFNNLSFMEKELNANINRAYASGLLYGFEGLRPYPEIELLKLYTITDDRDVYRYMEKELKRASFKKDDNSREITLNTSKPFIEPISDIRFRIYTFNSDIPGKERYCVENMEGTCLEKGINSFINLTGQGRLHKNITFFYEGQSKWSDESKEVTLKKGYIKIRTGKVSWELGKDSLWLGHGYHGSFLLSSNAKPFFLFKLDTEEPFRLPLFLEKIGEFKYTLFHGWLKNFNILGHRLAYKPFDILELGANQTATYNKNKGYNITDWPRILFSSEENVPGAYYNSDQRGSLDIALYMPFLAKIPPLKGGKIYAEYGGEDTFAWWQKEDRTWHGPLGFEFLGQGIMLGMFLTTGQVDLRVEYSENYRSYPLFYDWYKQHGIDYPSKGERWYRDLPFLNDDVLMGHHMGPEAEDLFFEIKYRYRDIILSGFYDRERHHLYNKVDQYHIYKATPEIRHQYGLDMTYFFSNFEINGMIIYNRYKNVDIDPSPLDIKIEEGRKAKELITGLALVYRWR